jgi:glycosyltransferase involved in cell wall biosynthesis
MTCQRRVIAPKWPSSMGGSVRNGDALKEFWPSVSVVVPVWNAETSLPSCISGVLSQDYPADKFEALFIDNLSRDCSFSILQSYGPRITVLQQSRKGSSAARNTGIRSARGEYIAFTDSDCTPQSQWLKELVLAARRNPHADFIGGRIGAWNPQSEIETFVETLYDQRAAIQRFHPPYAITANLLVKRGKLFELGLFNESLLRGQDVDLSYRGFFLQRSQFAYAPDAAVYHWNTKTVTGLFGKGWQHGKAASQVLKHYENELQTSRLKKCTDIKPYQQFMVKLPVYLKHTIRSRRDSGAPADVAIQYAFYDAVFRMGKQLGFVATTIWHR